MNLRKAARGQECQIRLPGCSFNPEETVLAHYRMSSGIGLKPHDEQAAYACHYCHDVVDGRRSPPPGLNRDHVRLSHAEGVFRTQELRRKAEVV